MNIRWKETSYDDPSFENEHKERIIAAKGAPEAILNVSNLSEEEKNKIRNIVKEFGEQGYQGSWWPNLILKEIIFLKSNKDLNF
jgi:Ca2+-transporting ATPase